MRLEPSSGAPTSRAPLPTLNPGSCSVLLRCRFLTVLLKKRQVVLNDAVMKNSSCGRGPEFVKDQDENAEEESAHSGPERQPPGPTERRLQYSTWKGSATGGYRTWKGEGGSATGGYRTWKGEGGSATGGYSTWKGSATGEYRTWRGSITGGYRTSKGSVTGGYSTWKGSVTGGYRTSKGSVTGGYRTWKGSATGGLIQYSTWKGSFTGGSVTGGSVTGGSNTGGSIQCCVLEGQL